MQNQRTSAKPRQRMLKAFVTFGFVNVLLLSGCQHLPQPWLSTHATWMNATAIKVVPPKSAVHPRVTQPYCVDSSFYGHYGDCWRVWPEGWQQCRPGECEYSGAYFAETEVVPAGEETEVLPAHVAPLGEVVVPRLDTVAPNSP